MNSNNIDNNKKLAENMKIPVIDSAYARENLYVAAINIDLNKERLSTLPHRKAAGDVALILKMAIEDIEGNRASAFVTEDLLSKVKLTSTEAFGIAMANTVCNGYKVETMAETLIAMGLPEEIVRDMDNLPMLVVSSKDYFDGAAGVFFDEDLRQELVERFDSEVCVLPSSIFEVIAVPAGLGDAEVLRNIVSQVNQTELLPEDILSSDVFHIDRNLKLTSCLEKLDSITEGFEEIEELIRSHGMHL